MALEELENLAEKMVPPESGKGDPFRTLDRFIKPWGDKPIGYRKDGTPILPISGAMGAGLDGFSALADDLEPREEREDFDLTELFEEEELPERGEGGAEGLGRLGRLAEEAGPLTQAERVLRRKMAEMAGRGTLNIQGEEIRPGVAAEEESYILPPDWDEMSQERRDELLNELLVKWYTEWRDQGKEPTQQQKELLAEYNIWGSPTRPPRAGSRAVESLSGDMGAEIELAAVGVGLLRRTISAVVERIRRSRSLRGAEDEMFEGAEQEIEQAEMPDARKKWLRKFLVSTGGGAVVGSALRVIVDSLPLSSDTKMMIQSTRLAAVASLTGISVIGAAWSARAGSHLPERSIGRRISRRAVDFFYELSTGKTGFAIGMALGYGTGGDLLEQSVSEVFGNDITAEFREMISGGMGKVESLAGDLLERIKGTETPVPTELAAPVLEGPERMQQQFEQVTPTETAPQVTETPEVTETPQPEITHPPTETVIPHWEPPQPGETLQMPDENVLASGEHLEHTLGWEQVPAGVEVIDLPGGNIGADLVKLADGGVLMRGADGFYHLAADGQEFSGEIYSSAQVGELGKSGVIDLDNPVAFDLIPDTPGPDAINQGEGKWLIDFDKDGRPDTEALNLKYERRPDGTLKIEAKIFGRDVRFDSSQGWVTIGETGGAETGKEEISGEEETGAAPAEGEPETGQQAASGEVTAAATYEPRYAQVDATKFGSWEEAHEWARNHPPGFDFESGEFALRYGDTMSTIAEDLSMYNNESVGENLLELFKLNSDYFLSEHNARSEAAKAVMEFINQAGGNPDLQQIVDPESKRNFYQLLMEATGRVREGLIMKLPSR